MNTRIEAKQRLQASDWKKDLDEVRSEKLQKFVQSLSALVEIDDILTDGLNDDEAGVQVIFSGKNSSVLEDPSFGSGGTISLPIMQKIINLIPKSPNIEVEFHPVDDGLLGILLLDEADKD